MTPLLFDPNEKPSEPFFKQTNLNLDQEVVFLASRKLWLMTGNKRMLSSFVNQVLTEFASDDKEHPEVSVRQQARDLAEKVRKEKMAQRQLIHDAETQRIEQEKADAEKREFIEQQTRLAIRKLGFCREYLRDKNHMCYENKRIALADEVAIACRADLQWKDISAIVSKAVFEEASS